MLIGLRGGEVLQSGLGLVAGYAGVSCHAPCELVALGVGSRQEGERARGEQLVLEEVGERGGIEPCNPLGPQLRWQAVWSIIFNQAGLRVQGCSVGRAVADGHPQCSRLRAPTHRKRHLTTCPATLKDTLHTSVNPFPPPFPPAPVTYFRTGAGADQRRTTCPCTAR